MSQVLIVGCGPVGKLLALLLGRRGVEVLVVDRQVRQYPLPRAVTHDSEFARVLQNVGLAPDTIPEITMPYDALYRWCNQVDETLLEVDWRGVGPSGWNNTWFFHQPSLEERLEQLLVDVPTVQIRRGWRASDHESRDDGETIVLSEVESGQVETVDAQYVIGADGANSIVRQWMSSSWHDLGYFSDWLVVDVTVSPELHFPHTATQVCDPARPSTLVPGGPGRRRWEFMVLPEEDVAEVNRLDSAWRLLAPYGVTAENATLERHSVYRFQAGWATSWRRGRLLLAGDAAHLMPPFAGQGLGAGVRDVLNLAWKLDLALSTGADALLDTYDTERLPHAAAFVDFSIELGRVICLTDPEAATKRDVELIAQREASGEPPRPPQPRLGPGCHQGAHGGELSVQGVVDHAGGRGRLDDVLGGPGVLLLRAAGDLDRVDADLRGRLAAVGVHVLALAERPGDAQVVDVDATYAAWFDQLGAQAVLIRPDCYLFGAADTGGGVVGLATDFLAALG